MARPLLLKKYETDNTIHFDNTLFQTKSAAHSLVYKMYGSVITYHDSVSKVRTNMSQDFTKHFHDCPALVPDIEAPV